MTRQITLNTRAMEIEDPMTYEQLVELAGKTGTPTVVWYARSGDTSRDGSLHPGATLPACEWLTHITIAHTGCA